MDSAFAELRQRELLRLLVHEIRNPVAAALYSTELINRNLSKIPDAPPTMPSFVSNARASIFNVESILSQVARFARAATDEAPQTTAATLLSWWTARTDIAAKDYRIALGEGSHTLVKGHVDRLAVCLDAIVRNAVDAQHFAEEAAPIRIVASANDTNTHIRISIIDDGDGVSETTLSKLCEAFVTDAPETHLGLGLKLAKSIANEYGAKIELAHRHAPTQFDLLLSLETLS